VCRWIWLLRIISGLMRLRLFKLPCFFFFLLCQSRMVMLTGLIGWLKGW